VISKILRSIYHKHFRFKKFKALGRVACLGNEIIKQIGWNENYIDHRSESLYIDYQIFSNHHKILKDVETYIYSYNCILSNTPLIGKSAHPMIGCTMSTQEMVELEKVV
jgi:hypothetical protein